MLPLTSGFIRSLSASTALSTFIIVSRSSASFLHRHAVFLHQRHVAMTLPTTGRAMLADS